MIRRAITGGDGGERSALMTIDTTKTETGSSANDTVRIPINSGSGLLYIKWGDGNEEWHAAGAGGAEHTYSVGGVYDVEIYNSFSVSYSNSSSRDKLKLTEIKQWGGCRVGYQSYFGCSNLALVSATDVPGIEVSMTSAFRDCSSLVSMDVSNWDVSNVTSMGAMFSQSSSLTTLDVSSWDVSSVTNMNNMFNFCSSLTNLDVSNWDVSNVTSLNSMFYQASSLVDLPIQNWNIENVSNFGAAFATGVTIPTVTYDQILNNWSAQNVNPSLNVHFGNSQYSPTGLPGRDDLINNHGWVLTDGGPV